MNMEKGQFAYIGDNGLDMHELMEQEINSAGPQLARQAHTVSILETILPWLEYTYYRQTLGEIFDL